MKASIIIGLGYGDEGKGVTIDNLSKEDKNQIVIRFSGGQQAGHTVIRNGYKHIYSSFGSGTSANKITYLTEDCTFYPSFIMNEALILNENGKYPKLYIHPLAKLTTPFDIFLNKTDHNNLEHGTCGMGVGKTMKRHIESPYKLYAIDLTNMEILIQKLKNIAKYYGLDYNDPNLAANLEYYLESCKRLFDNKELEFGIKDYCFLKSFDELLFEGSQGILLDMDHGIFPNVTYSNTHSKNAIKICRLLKIEDITTYYITRCYSTRHGSGPFKESKIKLINNSDEINKYNDYQKEFRLGELDSSMLKYAISIDKIYNSSKSSVLVITCLDQRPDVILELDSIIDEIDTVVGSYSSKNSEFSMMFSREHNIDWLSLQNSGLDKKLIKYD